MTVDGNALTIRASVTELWGTHEGQTFLATPVTGDYQVTAQIIEPPTNVTDNLADFLLQSGDLRRTRNQLRQFVALTPADAAARQHLAIVERLRELNGP